ncbi:MAG: chloride channel protein [Bacteroidia bacterium]|nr:chloride channel protein [Bacteroidia bacterium]
MIGILWKNKYIGKKTLLILASIIVGILSALSAVFLKRSVHLVQSWVDYLVTTGNNPYIYLVFPPVGIILTVVYVQVFRKGNLERGVNNILFSISRKASFVSPHKLYSQIISSIFTVGFGGSAGMESPISGTGSAIGSNLARILRFGYKERTLLLACGAAAGISAIFNAPIAGLIFAFEIILMDVPVLVIVPLIISSSVAALISKLTYSGQPFVLITDTWNSGHIGYYVLLAILVAFVSVYAIKMYFIMDGVFTRLRQPYLRAVIGGLMLGISIFLFPALYGEGYDDVQAMLHNDIKVILHNTILFNNPTTWTLVVVAVSLVLLKVIATSFTVGAGGNGGMFGSSLFTGAMLGFAFSRTINLLGFAQLNEVNFIVLGMAGALSGIIHSPLTAIFLIAEITGGYALFVPLMMVSAISFLITKYFEPYSVYTRKLALKGDLKSMNKDRIVLERMNIRRYVEKDFVPVHPGQTLRDLIHAVRTSKRNVFPVTDEEDRLVGIILLDDIRQFMFSEELYDNVVLGDLMEKPPATVEIDENMVEVMKKFDALNAWNLPVTEKEKYVGFVSKSKLFSRYRELLIKDTDYIA